VGISGGLGAVLFREMVQLSHQFFFGLLLPLLPSSYFIILLPVLGGLIIGPVVYRLVPEARGDGIPHIMKALLKWGGDIRKRVGLVLILSSAITLGSGGSAGREGPIALIGASAGSSIGKILKLSSQELKVLTTCGVAAGIAGTFDAPMGGAIFAMEVVSKRFSSSDAVPVLLSAVVGKAVAASLINPVPDFINPAYRFTTFDLMMCFLIGPIFGLLSFLWVRAYYLVEDFFVGLKIPSMLKPAAGGIIAGVCGLYFYSYGIMGVGYDGINNVFFLVSQDKSNQILLLLMALGVLKMMATASSVGSGGSGGAFAPTLYIGTMFGLATGILAYRAFPQWIVNPLDYGLLGMGAFFAGTAGAPLTCTIMIPEMIGNYSGLPPLIVACMLSYTTANFLLKGGTIYTIKLMREGIFVELPKPILESVSVGEAMQKDVVTVRSDLRVSEARERIFRYNFAGFPVVDAGNLVGMVTFDDIRKIPPQDQERMTVGEIAARSLITIDPHLSAKYAMDLMHENGIGRLPVVDKNHPGKLLGIITRTDVIRAYERQMEKTSPRA
jgi:CIC family chloride channel protein